MDGAVDGTKLIQRHKLELLEALIEDPDFLLQHCHARGILSNNEYNNIKDINTRSKQARDILDYVILKDNKHALTFLKLLKTPEIQETFPKLHFLQNLPNNKRKTTKNTETTAKRRSQMENDALKEQRRVINSRMVRESEMMKVAGCIGNNWRQVGIMALDMTTTTLEQIEEDNKLHKERVFAMLRRWSMREREKATPARLYCLLTQEEENGINSEDLNFLMENN